MDVTRIVLYMKHRKTDTGRTKHLLTAVEGDCELASLNMVGFEVVTAVNIKIAVLCDAVPRSLVDTCRRFRRTSCIISVN